MNNLKRYFYKSYLIIQRKDLRRILQSSPDLKGLTFREFLSIIIDYYGFYSFDIVKNVYIFY